MAQFACQTDSTEESAVRKLLEGAAKGGYHFLVPVVGALTGENGCGCAESAPAGYFYNGLSVGNHARDTYLDFARDIAATR